MHWLLIAHTKHLRILLRLLFKLFWDLILNIIILREIGRHYALILVYYLRVLLRLHLRILQWLLRILNMLMICDLFKSLLVLLITQETICRLDVLKVEEIEMITIWVLTCKREIHALHFR